MPPIRSTLHHHLHIPDRIPLPTCLPRLPRFPPPALRLSLLLVLLLLPNPTATQSSSPILGVRAVLIPGAERRGERLPYDDPTATALYRLEGLQRGATYEVKISYPGTTPTAFAMEMVLHSSGPPDSPPGPATAATERGGLRRLGRRPGRRRLLDTEKVIFVASHDSATMGDGAASRYATDPDLYLDPADSGPATFVRVAAARRSVTYREDVRQRPVVYNIVLDRLYFGAVPGEAGKVVSLCLLLVACVVKVAPWLAAKIANESTQHVQ